MSRDADARDGSLITPDAAMRITAHFSRLRAWNSRRYGSSQSFTSTYLMYVACNSCIAAVHAEEPLNNAATPDIQMLGTYW
jgi:hypothetical protein